MKAFWVNKLIDFISLDNNSHLYKLQESITKHTLTSITNAQMKKEFSQSSSHNNNNYYNCFPQIQLHPSISKKQIQRLSQSTQFESQFFTLILYNYLETPKLEEFLQTSIEAEGELCLVRREIKTGSYQFLKEDEKEYEYFLLYMVNENTPLMAENQHQRPRSSSQYNNEVQQLKPILTTLISLCDKVVVFDLDKEKQAFVEKVFVDMVSTCQKIKWQTTLNRVHRLVFIRDCYNNQKLPSTNPTTTTQPHITTSALTASTTINTLQYYSSLGQYQCHIQQQKQRYMYFRSQFELVNEGQFIDGLIRDKKVVRRISLKEILHVYEKIMEMKTRPVEEIVLEGLLMQFLGQKERGSEKVIKIQLDGAKDATTKVNLDQPWKVRYYIQKVYQLQSIARLHSVLQLEIFHPDTTVHNSQHIQKQLKKYLSSSPNSKLNNLIFSHANFSHFDYIPPFMTQVTISVNSREKLLWKLNRLQKYQRQLHQESKISPLNSADKIFYELRDDEITFWLEKYAQQWTQKSFSHLKTYFNKIANQKDHKAIQEFKQQCYKMQERLNKFDTKMFDQQKQSLIQNIRKEMNSFVQYHNDVIEMKRFAGLRYFWKDAQYMIKHKENVRNKLILFVLVLVLALMQKNLVAGLTLGTMAIIVLAIRL